MELVCQKDEGAQDFQYWCRKIRPLMELLKKSPSNTLEELILSGEINSQACEAAGVSAKCSELFDKLELELRMKKQEATTLWAEIQVYWKTLNEEENEKLLFSCGHVDIVNMLSACKSQFIAREKDREKRIEVEVIALRKDIARIWEACMIPEEDRNFKEFSENEFTLAVLKIHADELKKWQSYYKEHENIFSITKEWQDLLSELKQLALKENDVNRFINRGGTLLQDQQRKKYILKSMPKLETELKKFAEAFEKKYGKPIKVLGREIPTMIKEELQILNENKASISKRNQTSPSITTNSRKSLLASAVANRVLEKRPAPSQSQYTPLAKLAKFRKSSSMHSLCSLSSTKKTEKRRCEN